MITKNSWRIRVSQILLGAVVIAMVVARSADAGEEHEHLVTDWSHHHLVYSEPHTLMKRFHLSNDPRYVQQVRRKIAERRGIDRDEWRWRRAIEHPDKLHGDWSVNMGAGATVGPTNYPAKFSFDSTSANCATPAPPVGQQPDFVVYNTSLPGSSSQATIAAFTNLYSSCSSSPSVYWAYNTGTTGAVVTSPVLSFDGSQVAFIQSTPGAATLVILRWAPFSGILSSPVAPTIGSCTALTAPCQTTLTFSNANSDTNPTDTLSSPFYDYATDTLFVGDAFGFMHKFTGVFLGTPAEVVCTSTTMTAGCTAPAGTNLWPAIVDSPFAQLNSPVGLDSLNEILVTDNQGLLGVVDMKVGGIDDLGSTTTIKLANTGFDDAPIVDLTAGKVYLFARADAAASATAVFQLQVPAFADALDNATGPEVLVSNSATNPTAFLDGALDDAYYSSGGTGNLYACGTSGTSNALWRIPITSGVMGTPVLGPTLTTANGACSPITEFLNGSTDRIFVSVTGNALTGAPISCPFAAGCIMSFDITNPATWGTTTSPAATATVTQGTSGIVIDNSSSAGGASQVYFTPLADQPCTTSGGTGGCAIQASQSGLE